MIKIVGVRFRSAGKVYYFDPRDLMLRMGDMVIAETSKGLDYGVISTCMKMVDETLVQQPLRPILRKTTPEDEEKIKALQAREKEALKVCREKVREHELEMKMVNAEYSFDETKVLFYFTADGRVDFRSLVKDLASVFHVRIELRQIGVRDETRMLGGIGICGRELCCATFLRDFQPVSIKMAKEQNLSLNPAKISGACGRLMCCLKNEEATYEFLNAKMPKMGEEAITADGQVGKVIELDVLRQRVRVLFEEGDTKEAEIFPVEALTFRPKKKKDPSQQGKKAKAEKNGKDEKPEKTEKGPKTGKAEKSEYTGKAVKGEKGEKGESTQKAGRGEKGESIQKTGKGEKGESTQKAGRGEKSRKTGKGEKGENLQKSAKSERYEQAARSENRDRPVRADRKDGDQEERSERRHPRRRKNTRQEEGAAQPGMGDSLGAETAGGDPEKNNARKHRRHRPRPKNEEQTSGAGKPDGPHHE